MSEAQSPRTRANDSALSDLMSWQKKPRFSWTPAYEATFFQSLCESVRLGLRENQSFKPEAWNRALAALQKQGAYPDKTHLINKTDNARKKFRLWRGLMENPRFTYSPSLRCVAASEEAWQAHLEKEPLARAFRDRPFDYADYLEIIFPDVVGSRGQPKRITRPRRKDGEYIDDEAPPGTGIMRLLPRSTLPNNNTTTPPTTAPTAATSSTAMSMPTPPVPSAAAPMVTPAGPGRQAGPNAVPMRPPPPANTTGPGPAGTASTAGTSATTSSASIVQPPPMPASARQLVGRSGNASATALTPPDEANPMGQKRYSLPQESSANSVKRRRTDNGGNLGTGGSNHSGGSASGGGGGMGESAVGAVGASGGANTASIHAAAGNALAANNIGYGASTFHSVSEAGGNPVTVAGGGPSGPSGPPGSTGPTGARPSVSGQMHQGGGFRSEGISSLLTDILTKYATATTLGSATRWPEQALEIFFHEFADEDMDLQCRIAEKMLTDTSKAIMFCKMPPPIRRHWVKRLREVLSSRLNG